MDIACCVAVSFVLTNCVTTGARLPRRAASNCLTRTWGYKHGDMINHKLGDVTTINITALKAGVSNKGGKINTVALNVVLTEATTGFDVRIAPNMEMAEFKVKMKEWCAEEGVSWASDTRTNPLREHKTLDKSNIWWTLFEEAQSSIGIKLDRHQARSASSSRRRRSRQRQTAASCARWVCPAPASRPWRNTAIPLHKHNESVPKHVFLEGIDVYEIIFRNMFAHVDAHNALLPVRCSS
jgi:aminoacylase